MRKCIGDLYQVNPMIVLAVQDDVLLNVYMHLPYPPNQTYIYYIIIIIIFNSSHNNDNSNNQLVRVV